jgi:hypothetical protein
MKTDFLRPPTPTLTGGSASGGMRINNDEGEIK